MKPLVLTLRGEPEQRLDLSPLLPQRLKGLTPAAVEAIPLQTTRQPITVGDAFRLRPGDVETIRIVGGSERLDRVGEGLDSGAIEVEGDVGQRAGRGLSGGRLTIHGDAGPCAGSGMSGGMIEIRGAAGPFLAGPLPGEMAGMRGGTIIVRGDAGERAADRLRRGTIVIEGRAGAYAGSRMIAGTLILCGPAGALPGYLMKRGTIILGRDCEALAPTFVDSGIHDLVALRLLARSVAALSSRAEATLRRPLQRLAGDTSVLGKGELFCRSR